MMMMMMMMMVMVHAGSGRRFQFAVVTSWPASCQGRTPHIMPLPQRPWLCVACNGS